MPELVVAHYTEDLNWLRNVPAGLLKTVYTKGPVLPDEHRPIPLPNVGREAHTYLHHIATRYDTLAEWTIFCQGKPFDHAYDFKKTLLRFTTNPESISSTGFCWLGHLIDTDDYQGHRLFRPWSKNQNDRGLDLRGFHQALLSTHGPDNYTFVLGAQFAVHRRLIRQQPLSFYEQALAISVSFPDAAHCYERSWDRVFGVVGIDSDWLAGRRTVYLKPMKHQQAH